MTRSLRVFLCHSSNDKPAVRELYQKLRAETWIQPWLDEEELYPGQDWNLEIEKAVEASDAILVCLTKGSITKEGYVQRELRTVLDFADYKPEGTLYIIPVRLEECEPPRRLRAWQYADYFEGQRERAFQRLLISLKRRADALGMTEGESAGELIEAAVKNEKALAEKAAREREERERIERLLAWNQAMKETERLATPLVEVSRIDPQQTVLQKISAWFKRLPAFRFRQVGIGVIVLIGLIMGGFGLNYINNHPPVATAVTQTIDTPTLTSVPNTFTPQLTETPVIIPTLEINSNKVSDQDGMVLVYISAGEFLMGATSSDSSASSDEKPQHSVKLNAFWIDQTEVTNAMYAKCVANGGACIEPTNTSSNSHSSYYGNSEFNNYPVLYVDWNMANAYCAWADRRLPTEAEWEKAARGIDARTYPWGNDAPNNKFLNYNSAIGDTTEVGKYPDGTSIYGAYDMAGNVWEWVSSIYQPYPYDGNDGREDLGSSGSRVVRGGSWNVINYGVRSTYRFRVGPSTISYFDIGFRCARSP